MTRRMMRMASLMKRIARMMTRMTRMGRRMERMAKMMIISWTMGRRISMAGFGANWHKALIVSPGATFTFSSSSSSSLWHHEDSVLLA